MITADPDFADIRAVQPPQFSGIMFSGWQGWVSLADVVGAEPHVHVHDQRRE
jgi:hypothetical protein